MSLKIYFLRHGETTYSQRGAFCGAIDPELTPEGQQMAIAFADTYSSLAGDGIYVSPMKRIIATAQPICDSTGVPMQIRDGLREIGYGAWEDREQEDIKLHFEQDYIRWLTEPAWNPPTAGELVFRLLVAHSPLLPKLKLNILTVTSWSYPIKLQSALSFAA